MGTVNEPYIHYPTAADRTKIANLITRFGGDATALIAEVARQGGVAVATLDRDDVARHLAEHGVTLTDSIWTAVFEENMGDYDDFVGEAGTDREFIAKLATGDIDGVVSPEVFADSE